MGGMGFGRSDQDMVKEKTMKALRQFLRPEFINRVDEIITFNHLTKENFVGIAEIMLRELQNGLADRAVLAFRLTGGSTGSGNCFVNDLGMALSLDGFLFDDNGITDGSM